MRGTAVKVLAVVIVFVCLVFSSTIGVILAFTILSAFGPR